MSANLNGLSTEGGFGGLRLQKLPIAQEGSVQRVVELSLHTEAELQAVRKKRRVAGLPVGLTVQPNRSRVAQTRVFAGLRPEILLWLRT